MAGAAWSLMCGRFALHKEQDALAEALEIEQEQLADFQPSFNIAPSHNCLVIEEHDQQRTASFIEWGLIPEWSETTHKRLINARSETLSTKASFKHLIAKNRIAVPMSGYFEWLADKTPFYITKTDNSLIFAAGLYTDSINAQGQSIKTFTIITRDADSSIKKIHHRMPVILDSDMLALWLSDKSTENRVLEILRETQAALKSRKVDRWVNKISNNSPRCIADPPPPNQLELF